MKHHDFTERKLPLLAKSKRRLPRFTLYRGCLVLDSRGKTWSLTTVRDLLAAGLGETNDPQLIAALARLEDPQ